MLDGRYFHICIGVFVFGEMKGFSFDIFIFKRWNEKEKTNFWEIIFNNK
jgi:hypothetical protein